MGRPLGSKNKARSINKSSISKPIEVENPKQIAQLDICHCGHGEDMHYGTPDRWCNWSRCECQALERIA